MNDKVYILTEHNYNRECGEEVDSWILGVFTNEKKAKEEMKKVMENDIENEGYIYDNETENIVFFGEQENWNNYIEYRITEKEVE